jgi:hypothetical protein
VRASPSSSERARHGFALWLALACALGTLAFGCATVRPEQRERLADPAMNFESTSMGQRHEQHVVENREGSSGGGTARGGGCGCN